MWFFNRQKQQAHCNARTRYRVRSPSHRHHATPLTITNVYRSNKGIGLAVVRGLAKTGADVFLTARDVTRGSAALTALQGEGLQANFFALDVTKPDSIAAAAEHVKTTGGLDVLVCFGRVFFCFFSPSLLLFLSVLNTPSSIGLQCRRCNSGF